MIDLPLYLFLFAIFILLMLLSFYFSGIEVGFLSLNREQLAVDQQQGNVKVKRIDKLVKNTSLVLAVALLGNNLCNIAIVIVSNRLWNRFVGIEFEYTFVLSSTLVLLLWGEIIPKVFFRRLPNGTIYDLSLLLLFFSSFFKPVIHVITKSTDPIVNRIFDKGQTDLTRQDLSNLMDEGHEHGVVEEKEKLFIKNFANLSNTRVGEIMTPLVDVFMVAKSQDIHSIFEQTKEIEDMVPVYDKRIDNIIGFISLTESYYSSKKRVVAKDFLQECHYIPESITIEKIPENFKIFSEVPLVVIDEHGGCCGVLYSKNFLDNLFGFSYDPQIVHKKSLISKIDDVTYRVDPSFDIDHFNQMFQEDIEKDGFETLGGLINHLQRKVPKVGTVIKYRKYKFKITKAEKTSIEEIEMTSV